jgi:hypothetical protein
MNSILETITALTLREEQLSELMRSASDQSSQRDRAIQDAIESLESRVSAVQAEQKTNDETAVAKAVALSNEYTGYQNLILRIRQVVNRALPPDATVIVVSKGDSELLKLDGRNAWHFPQNDWGVYAGYYPANSAAAIAHLEALHQKGGQYLLFPRTALWWLDHYRELKEHLDKRYPVVTGPDDTCLIYSLRPKRTRSPKNKSAARKSPVPRRRTSGQRASIKRKS